MTEPDPDVKRELQRESMKHDLAQALRIDDCARFAIDAGANAAYVSLRYGVDLERCQRYAEAIAEQRAKRKAGTAAA